MSLKLPTEIPEISNFTTKEKKEQLSADSGIQLVRYSSLGPNEQQARIWVQSPAKANVVERLTIASVSKIGLPGLDHGSLWCWNVAVWG